MRSYLILFTTSLCLALGLTPLVRRWAVRVGAVDWPNQGRRIHRHPTPRLGGLAIYLSFLLTLLCVPLLNTLVGQGFRENWPAVVQLLAPATLILLLGVYDDFRGLKAPVKFAVQILAAALLYWGGLRVSSLSLPFGSSVELSASLSFPLTVLWVVGITNAFNLIDGIDGLAAGASAFALFTLFVCSLSQDHLVICLLCIVLVGSVMGFLRHNFNPATIFLGDSGSLFLGFMAAALSLASAQKSPTIIAVAIPLVAFGFPLVEVSLSVVRRLLGGDPLFRGDRRHIHHMLLKRGLTQRQVVILLYGVCALFSLFGLMLHNSPRNLAALIFIVLGIGIVCGVQHLRYVEFGALGRQIKEEAARRRRALAVSVRLQRTIADLRLAKTMDQLLTSLTEFVELNDFAGGTLEVSQAATFATSEGEPPNYQLANNGQSLTTWHWRRGALSQAELSSSSQFWSLRLPLADEVGDALGKITFYGDVISDDLAVDLTQICNSLRRELSQALVRLCYKDGQMIQPLSTHFHLVNKLNVINFEVCEAENNIVSYGVE